MARYAVTIIGLYNYNEDVFENLQVPQGVNKSDVIDTILETCGDFPLVYPNYDFMKMIISVWSRNHSTEWEKLQETITIEYDPISNYDRHETTSRNIAGSQSGESEREVNSSSSGTSKNDSSSSTKGTSTTKNPAFESGSMVPVVSGEETGLTTNAFDGSSSDTSKGTETGKTSLNSEQTDTFTSHVSGNIGVVSSQQMIEAQRSVVKFNMADYIAESFMQKFCIMIY